MSNRFFLDSRHNPIFIEKQPFASGGEGNLYRIITAKYRDCVVKIYHPEKRTAAKEGKVKYLVQNPPDTHNVNGHNSVVWATGVVYDEKGFVGLMMPYAEGDKLVVLTSSKISKKYQATWGRFSLSNPQSGQLRMAICFNIAAAVYQIHATNKYVLVDLKPDNIIIRPNGLVAIVDVDSMEVLEKDKVLYPALVTTPEFAPPEFHKGINKPGQKSIYPSWDNYALAIIFYKLLFGVHPFAGSASAPFDKFNTLEEKIEHGLFVHSPNKRKYINVLPPPHQRFNALMPQMRELFIQCFEDGHDFYQRRPSASDWCTIISGKSLVYAKRKLPSRVLSLEPTTLSQPRPLPNTSNLFINTDLIPRVEKMEIVHFENNMMLERILLGAMALFIYTMVQGSFVLAVLASFAILGIKYHTRREVKKKKRLNKDKYPRKYEIGRQEYIVMELKNKVTSYNRLYDNELNQITSKQYQILLNERNAISNLQNIFSEQLAEKDKALLNLEEEENKEIEALEAKFAGIKERKTASKSTDSKEQLNQQINVLMREIDDIMALQQNPDSLDFSSKQYLLSLGHKLDTLNKDRLRAEKDLDLYMDTLIANENKKLNTPSSSVSKAVREEVYNKMSELRNEKTNRILELNAEYTEKEKSIREEKSYILKEELDKLNTQINRLKIELESQESTSEKADESLTEYKATKKWIEDKYDVKYQLILEESQKKQKKIMMDIQNIKNKTAAETEQLFSTAIIPFEGNTNLLNYSEAAKNLVQLKEEDAKREAELKSYQDITFGKYLEMILTFK
jgi:serine/threonine protein kinase